MADRTWVHAFTDGRDVSPHAAARRPRRAPRRAHRDGLRPLLRDGQGQPVGAGQSVRADAILVGKGAHADGSCRGRPGELRAGRHRRVRRAGRAGRPTPTHRRRRGDLLQLSPGSSAAALAAASRGRHRPDDDDALPGRLPVPGRVRRAGGPEHACGGARVARGEAAPRRRDREVRARHLLLQRRRGAGVGGRDADPRPLTSGRPQLRPQTGDVCSRGRAEAVRRDRRGVRASRS